MERLGSLRVGTSVTLDTGHTLRARKLLLPEEQIEAGPVAGHEIAHVAGSKFSIEYATIIPNGNALGLTKPNVLTKEGAGAAAGLGYAGGQHDLVLAKVLFDSSPEETMAAGRAEVAGLDEEMDVLSRFLQYRKTIYQRDVDEGLQLVSDRRRGIHRVAVDVTDRRGKTKTFETRSYHNMVEMEKGQIYDLPKVA